MDINLLAESIFNEAKALHWAEVSAVILGIVYVVLAARANVWCWFWGILSSALWAYATFTLYDLYIDALLQVFYVVMGFVGIYQWKFSTKDNTDLLISKLPSAWHIYLIIGGLFSTFFIGYFFDTYTLAAATYLDAFTTVFAIIATFLTVQKRLENWIYWMVINVFYIYLYSSRGGYLFALLFVLYIVISISGYLQWKKEYEKQV